MNLGGLMKRLLLLPVLMLGLSFSCDQPHEEVAGIKIGCPFSGSKGSLKSDNDRPGILTQELKLKDSFFETVRIDVLEGNIEGLTFSKHYQGHQEMGKDFEAVSIALKDKWGETREIKTDGLNSFSIDSPKSNNLDSVFIFNLYDYSGGSISVSYVSKNITEHNKKIRDKDREERVGNLKGF